MPQKMWNKLLKKVSLDDDSLYASSVKAILSLKGKPVFKRLEQYVPKEPILDIGVGIGGVFYEFKKNGYTISGIDVSDLSLIKEAVPTVYDGFNIPFKDNEFGSALLVHVLHHCSDSDKVLTEAKRVAKRVIFIEDTYRSEFERKIVSANDMIGNAEFFEHKYKTVDEWRAYIKNKGWKLVAEEEYTDFVYGFMYGRYYLAVIES